MLGQCQPGFRALLIVLLVTISGCNSHSFYELMPTPNLYLRGRGDPFDSVPPALRSSDATVLYVTDRVPLKPSKRGQEYGYGRDRSMAFGTLTVHLAEGASWETLVAVSREQKRKQKYEINCSEIIELGRFPATPEAAVERDGVLVPTTQVVEERDRADAKFRETMAGLLARSDRKDVYLFVHGYNCEFEWGSYVMAQLWHFMGRGGVPVSYSWPSGRPGMLRGYQYDRESGEFTVYHLKQFLKLLSSCPDVAKVHIIAHSRGTDVITTALRELKLEMGNNADKTRQTLKLGELVLAAADLDADVMTQRLGAERMQRVAEFTTIYVSKGDQALGMAEWLFGSRQRVGMIQPEDLRKEQIQMLQTSGDLEAVDVEVKTPKIFSHSYFIANPAASSDLILLVRDGLKGGAKNGRPMKRDSSGFWIIDDSYPNFGEKTEKKD